MDELNFPVLTIDSPGGREIIRTIRKQGAVALIGSAISMFEPSGLPVGIALTKALAELLSGPCEVRELIQDLVGKAAFEHIIEACPQKERVGDNLVRLFADGKPNPLHELIAVLFKHQALRHVITTNYDPCLERALEAASVAFQVVVGKDQALAADPSKPVLFKIHGCAAADAGRSPGTPRSMVFHLGGEGVLPDWKRALLRALTADSNVLVVGYSGLDFELCPEISNLKPKIFWNCYRDPRESEHSLKPNARRVVESTKGSVLVGDMCALLLPLLAGEQEMLDLRSSPPPPGLPHQLAEGLDEWDLNLWRVTLFAGIGCAREGIRLGEAMLKDCRDDPDRRFHALHGLGRALFHGGWYLQAAARYQEATDFAQKIGNHEQRLGAELQVMEAERCAGHWRRAWQRGKGLDREITDPWLKAELSLRKIFLLNHAYQISTLMFLRPLLWPLTRIIRAKCKVLLKEVVKVASSRGAWQELQQCEMWAGRLGIPFSEIYSGPLIPLPSREGYRQLGYFVAESMALRDAVRKGVNIPEKPLRDALETAWELGAGAEMWKLAWTLARKGRWRILRGYRRKAFKMWAQCEYTVPLRLFLLLRP